MRRLIKFLHTMGAIGLMGSLAALLVLARLAPPPGSLAGYALIRSAMAEIGAWVVMPSLLLTLIPGLLAIAATSAFHEAGWAWIKAATGILILAGGLHALAPIQDESRHSAEALSGGLDPRDAHRHCPRRGKHALGAARGLDRQCRARHLAPPPHAVDGTQRPRRQASSSEGRGGLAGF